MKLVAYERLEMQCLNENCFKRDFIKMVAYGHVGGFERIPFADQ